MAEQLLGMLTQADWLEVSDGFTVIRPNDPFDAYFSDIKTENIFAAWESIASEYTLSQMASVHSYDTESLIAKDIPIDSRNIEKMLIKVKKNQSERVRALLRSGVQRTAMRDYVLNDMARLADQVVTRTKVAKAELMATGYVTAKENNLNISINYGVPADQLSLTLNISAEADVPGQIQTIIDTATAKGVTINSLATSGKNITLMRKNATLQKLIYGNMGAGALVRQADFNDFMATEYGITSMVKNDLTYALDNGYDTDGRPKVMVARYYPEDKVTFFATSPSGTLGKNLWGSPPEDEEFGQFFNKQQDGYVTISQWSTPDPVAVWTKASGLAVPVLYSPNSLFVATVTTTNP